MPTFLALLVACLAVLSQVKADSIDAVSFSSQTQCSTKKTLTFLFDEFSLAEFSRSVGAYQEDVRSCNDCKWKLVKDAAQKQHHSCVTTLAHAPVADVDGLDVNQVISAAKAPSGNHVINMKLKINDVTEIQDAIIFSALMEASAASQGDFTFVFTGVSAPNNVVQERRNLAAGDNQLLIRMTPDTFIGLVFLVLGHLLLIFFLCCCMDGISAQSKYAKQYPMRGKELN